MEIKVEIKQSTSNNLATEEPMTDKNPPSSEPQTYKKVDDAGQITNGDKTESKDGPSLMGTIFNMVNFAIGASIFAFGYRAASFGLIWMFVAIVICGFANYWSFILIVDGSKNLKENTYLEVVRSLFGKGTGVTITVFMIIDIIGGILSYIVIIYSLIGRFVESIFFHKKYAKFDDFNDDIWQRAYIKWPVFMALGIVLIICCLPKKMSNFDIFSYIAMGIIFYILAVFAVEAHSYYEFNKEKYIDNGEEHINLIDIRKAFTKELLFFPNMANLFFSYSCHEGIFSIFREFKPFGEAGTNKMKKASFYSVIIVAIFFVMSLIICFFVEPVKPSDLTIYRHCKDPDSYDIPLNIGKVGLVIALIFSTPLCYYPLKDILKDLFTGGELTTELNIISTIIIFLVCCIISALYDKILNYLSYVGGFVAVFIDYLFPALIHIKSTGKPLSYWRNAIDLTIAIVLCIIGVIAGILTIIDDYNN